MVICVLSSCKRCVVTRLKGIYFAITRSIAQCTLRLSQSSLKSGGYWLPASLTMSGWQLNSTCLSACLMKKKMCSVGVWETKIPRADTLSKKNTQICRLSVLETIRSVCYNQTRTCVPLIVAVRAKSVNTFARYCYV